MYIVLVPLDRLGVYYYIYNIYGYRRQTHRASPPHKAKHETSFCIILHKYGLLNFTRALSNICSYICFK